MNRAEIMAPILLSLKIAVISTFITLILGLILAYVFTKHEFLFKDGLEVILTLPMTLPPTIMGYILLLLFSRKGPIGRILYNAFDINVIFTWVAGCIAAVVVSLPLMYQSIKSSFLSTDPVYENVARTLGKSEFEIFTKVTIPLALPGIVSGIVLSFSRAIGEFGATLMVAGNIPGKTETIPLAIFYAVESNNRQKANLLMAIVIGFSFINIYLLNKWIKKRKVN
ncbi:molybdate ABC transporter permease subunit [Mediannikoviicoccus vaginalis]|uniref:molybdate ABC transporter permease subunit n=1 Tax=Mediannikoviicoccus vaginalis TaxID=2899727 RepID=UPI001F005102|nr:molybdate ABC transporter permease subunit [Mediannikoviicoccus vaginalis]